MIVRYGGIFSIVSRTSTLLLGCLLMTTTPTLGSGTTTPSLDEPFKNDFTDLKHAPCVTLFYRNGKFGCGTVDRDVQLGRLVYQDGETSFAKMKEPYVVVLDEKKMSLELMTQMEDDNVAGYWQGTLVLNTTTTTTSEVAAEGDGNEEEQVAEEEEAEEQIYYYSPAQPYPQGRRTPSQLVNYGNSAYKWNALGDGLIQQDFYGLPMVYVSDQDVSAYLAETSKSNELASRIMAKINYYMGPKEMTSKQCLAWHDQGDGQWSPKCLPIGGTSVWSIAGSSSSQDDARRRLNDANNFDDDDANNQNNNGERPVFIVATNMDATSPFHDATPAANTAATNILTTLMAAKLIGSNLDTSTIDGLSKRILFGFFQAETYGFVGSRAFLSDVAGFECDESLTVNSISKNPDSPLACLYPMRHSLDFQSVGEVAGMLTVDQVGVLATEQNFYVHDDNGDMGQFLSGVLQAFSSDDFTVNAASEINGEDDDHFDDETATLPPTPLTSLLSLTGGAIGGAVLTGYDDRFAQNAFYHSQLDSHFVTPIDLDSVAAAATLLARTAVAAAYDGGDLDYDTASEYAVGLIAEPLDSSDETLVELADCLLVSGGCDLLTSYAEMARKALVHETGVDSLGTGIPLGDPPNYYPSIFHSSYGQPVVAVNGQTYGAYNKDDSYGKSKNDMFLHQPKFLSLAVHGMMNDFLGATDSNDEDVTMKSCSNMKDCGNGVDYCDSNTESPICSPTTKQCVCARSHYHMALDEALEAAPNNFTGFFQIVEDDEEISAMYTEPFWSNDVGVSIYKDAGNKGSTAVLISGIMSALGCVFTTFLMRKQLVKEKLY